MFNKSARTASLHYASGGGFLLITAAQNSGEENRPRKDDAEWVALTTTNLEAYFGSSFGWKYLPKPPKEVFERSDSGYGAERYLVKLGCLPKI